jgi:hypothetical protein
MQELKGVLRGPQLIVDPWTYFLKQYVEPMPTQRFDPGTCLWCVLKMLANNVSL